VKDSVLDRCVDRRGGAPATTKKLTRVTNNGRLYGWLRALPDGKVRVAACHEGRIHILGIADDAAIAKKILILGHIQFNREKTRTGDEEGV
jgi:hypothetical protein